MLKDYPTIDLIWNIASCLGVIGIYWAMKHYQKKYEQQLRAIHDQDMSLIDDLKSLRGSACLVAIERNGRSLIFTFALNGEFIEIETMALMSSGSIDKLRSQLGLA